MSGERDYTTDQLRQLDALAAERVMGWKWVQAPKYDYNGPLPEQGLVLVPPTFDESAYQWPPKGVVSPHAFVSSRHYTTDIAAAMELFGTSTDGIIEKAGDGYWVQLSGAFEAKAKELPLAITLAALAARGVDAASMVKPRAETTP